MAMIAMISGKASPGVTTTVALMASLWPRPAVVAGLDPGGDDLVPGWLGTWLTGGWIRRDLGVLSFTSATRHQEGELWPHLQEVPNAPHLRLLVGVTDSGQAAAVGEDGWERVARALGKVSTDIDILVDCGRLGPLTPWPVVEAADLRLVVSRPQRRYLLAAQPLVDELGRRFDQQRVQLVVCGATTPRAGQVGRVLRLPVTLVVPDDLRAARVFSDGAEWSGVHRSRLVRSASQAVTTLARSRT